MSKLTLTLLLVGALLPARPVAADSPSGADALVGAELDRPISITFREAPLDRVLVTVGKLAGLKLEVKAGLSYRVSFEMRGVPARRALAILAESQGLVFRLERDVVRVEPVRPTPRLANADGVVSVPLGSTVRVLFLLAPASKAVPAEAVALFRRAIEDSAPNVEIVSSLSEATDVIELESYAWSPEQELGVSQTWRFWYHPLDRPDEPANARAKPTGFVEIAVGRTLAESNVEAAQRLRSDIRRLLARFDPVVLK